MSTYKDTNKWVRNMKFTSIFFKTSASILKLFLLIPWRYTFIILFLYPTK